MFRAFGFLAIFIVLLIVWLVSVLAFHIAGAFIHILLVIAVISLILHFVGRGRSSV